MDVKMWRYEPPASEPVGVQEGHLVLWSGETGPAQAIKVALLHESDGSFHVVPGGEFQPVDVVAG